MARVLERHGLQEFVCNFLDDFVVYSKDMDTHLLEHLPALLEALREEGLHCNPDKVHVACDSVDFLGYRVSAGSVAPLPEKLRVVADWPTPKRVRDLRSFLGLCNFYRAHVRGHAEA